MQFLYLVNTFKNPIERVNIASSVTLISFYNTDEAYLYGLEIEINKKLASWIGAKSRFSELSFGLNASLLYSQIHIGQNSITEHTNEERPLEGASPYLFNFDVNYPVNVSRRWESFFTLTYNVFGPRIFAAGNSGKEDIYELSVHTLDFIIKNNINEKWGINLNLRNLLNPEILRVQKVKEDNVKVDAYKKRPRYKFRSLLQVLVLIKLLLGEGHFNKCPVWSSLGFMLTCG